jgi:hypothetical protein
MKLGFSLLELALVLGIMSLLLITFLPRRQQEKNVGQDFIVRLNALVHQGAHAAIQSNQIQTVTVNTLSNTVDVTPLAMRIDIPKTIEFTAVVIDGQSQLKNGQATTFYFYILPDGATQEVSILFNNTRQNSNRPKTDTYELVLNPFTAQFKTL